jgi:antirestriction protein ArdC
MHALQPISKGENEPMTPKDEQKESGFSRKDVYTRVTERVIADLESGIRTWMKPWSVEHTAGKISRPLRHNGTPYRGMNVLLLWGEAVAKGYAAPIWMTFKQALELDAHVRKGEHGSLVVYANTVNRTETNDKGEDMEREIPFMKGYTVFNVEQIEGLPAHYYAKPENPLTLSERIESADRFMTATGATIYHGGNAAFYAPARDIVQMPPFEAFRDKESYYATALHELTHWTNHKSRLDRSFDAKRFGDHGYAREELVAELGAAFLCADLGITPEIRDDHAAYLGHWLNVLKEDKRAIFSAAAHAQRAADYLHGLQPSTASPNAVEPAAAEPVAA